MTTAMVGTPTLLLPSKGVPYPISAIVCVFPERHDVVVVQRTPAISRRQVESAILLVRGQKVMLDSDLATLYRVPTKRLNEQVGRNRHRFPRDFMFRLTPAEAQRLRSQIATSNVRRGGRRTVPYVFTEHGAVMLASVLRSRVAVLASIQVVRAFVRLRELLSSNAELARKLAVLEKRYDAKFKLVFDAIRALMAPEPEPSHPIGFRPGEG